MPVLVPVVETSDTPLSTAPDPTTPSCPQARSLPTYLRFLPGEPLSEPHVGRDGGEGPKEGRLDTEDPSGTTRSVNPGPSLTPHTTSGSGLKYPTSFPLLRGGFSPQNKGPGRVSGPGVCRDL